MLFCFDYIQNVSDILIRSAWKTLIFSTVVLNCSLLGLVIDSRKYVDVSLSLMTKAVVEFLDNKEPYEHHIICQQIPEFLRKYNNAKHPRAPHIVQ